MTEPFRILSLDGGGIRGLFSAAFLAHIEEQYRRPLAEAFDLIVGTSTGAILGLAIAKGLSARDAVTFYENLGPRVFAHPRALPLRWFRPKYDPASLYAALQEFFGDVPMSTARTRLCITSFEAVEGTPRVIKTDHAEGLHWGGDQLMWRVAAASSAAPTYFPAFRIGDHDCHLDGGVWANNPVSVGITEALRLDHPLADLAVLSVGTGSHRFTVPYAEATEMGLVRWARPSFDLIIGAQARAAHEQARLTLREGRYLRVDVNLERPIALDDHAGSVPLIERGYQAGRTNWAAVSKTFLK